MSGGKNFLYGFRGRRARKLIIVILSATVVIFLYFEVGEAAWSNALASRVPVVYKWLALALFLALAARRSWRIGRSMQYRVSRTIPVPWLVAEIIVAFTFAFMAADRHTLFYIGSILWVLVACGVDLFLRSKQTKEAFRGPK